MAVTMFSDPTEQAEAVSVPLVYGIVEMIIIGLYCVYAWKSGWTKAPPDEKLCVIMIKTYELHDSDPEDGDDMVEFDPQVVENLNWWQKCFVPKYPENNRVEDIASESSTPTTTQEKELVEEITEEERNRFYSEDVTVSTNLTTPPGTPDKSRPDKSRLPSSSQISSNNSSHNPSISDLETRSIRNVISAIYEESEEVEKSDRGSEDVDTLQEDVFRA